MTKLSGFAAAMILVLGTATAAPAHLTIAQRSVLLLNGSSNLAKWRCSGTTLIGTMEVDATLDKINEVIDRIEDGNMSAWMTNPEAGRFPAPRFDLTIPIEALRCDGGRPMERDLMNALKADRYPAIHFRFRNVSGAISHDIDGHSYHAVITGELSLAGTTREVELTVYAERLSAKLFRLSAEMPLRMTNFDIKPPRALFGIIRADDDLTVVFDLLLEPAS